MLLHFSDLGHSAAVLESSSGDVTQERDDSEQLVRELMRKTKKLQEEQAVAEQSLKV